MSAPQQAAPDRSSRGEFAVTAAALFAGAAILVAVIAVFAANSSSNGGGALATAEPVHVSLTEFKIAPSSIEVPKGGKLHIQNSGSQAHNFEVVGQNLKTPDLPAGASKELDVSKLAPGTYDVICAVSGHADSGMKGTLVVSTSASGGAVSAAAGGSGSDASHSADGGSHDWAAMDKAMADGMNTYLASLKPDAKPLTKGQGNQKLQPTIAPDGTKEFTLEGKVVDWETEPGKVVKAWTFNGQVPGPWIRVEPGDKVRVKYTNNTPAGSDIHWHGITTPFSQDGVAPLTQPMIQPGETFTYEFTAPNRPELGMYHPHNHGQVAVVNGMFAVFQVGDVPLPRGKTVGGQAIPADLKVSQELPIVTNDAGVIGLTLNGKGFPATGATVAKPGEWVLVHYYNEGLQSHPMHLHHIPQLVVAKEGFPLDSPYYADTINVAPGERYSVLVHPTNDDIGAWAWHCHILTHAEGDKGLQGMVTAFVVPDPNKPA